MPGRATALARLGLGCLARLVCLVCLGLAACNHDGPEDPAIAAPGAGIPVGAVGAVGVAFDAALVTGVPGMPAGETPAPRRRGETRPRRAPTATPDPFADLPDLSGDALDGGTAPAPPGARHPGRHSGGTAL